MSSSHGTTKRSSSVKNSGSSNTHHTGHRKSSDHHSRKNNNSATNANPGAGGYSNLAAYEQTTTSGHHRRERGNSAQPLLGVSSAAIIARNTPEKYQSSAQSLRFISEKIAQILSPIWVNNLTPASTNGPNGILIMLPSNILFALSLGIILFQIYVYE